MTPQGAWGAGGFPTLRVRAALVLTCLVLSAAPLAASEPDADPCEGFTYVAYQGPSCPVEGGWLLPLADGTTVFTHGPDPVPSTPVMGPDVGSYRPWPPACAASSSARSFLLIYAYPNDRASRAVALEPLLRSMVNDSNGQYRAEARLFDADMSLRFRCEPSGLIRIAVEPMPFANAGADYWNIVSALQSRGYTSTVTKYLVFYDGSIGGGIAGQATVSYDERPGPENWNNHGADFAINYGYLDTLGAHVSLHEMGHVLGAVQYNAPESSGGAHCNDGLDTMCYSDGGDKAAYRNDACSDRTHWDCNHDTYFHPNPPVGSWLASHWNLASPNNLYLQFGTPANYAPEMRAAACANRPSLPGELRNCTFIPHDAEGSFGELAVLLNVTIDWGDGTQSVVGPVPSDSVALAGHAWPAQGRYTVRAWATDDGAPARTSAPLAFEHVVACTARASGNLVVGLNGVETTLSSRNVAVPPCSGQPFRLTGNAPNDFDLCWYAEDTLLECHATEGNEEGIVPEGVTSARIILRLGALGAYNLFVDPPGDL